MVKSVRAQCSVEDCVRLAKGFGYCNLHYQRYYRWGDPLGGRPEYPKDVWQRFLTHFEVQPNGCWIWQSGKDKDGYGLFKYKGKTWRAHMFAHVHKYGEAPKGLVFDHVVCDTPACVNPDHLELKTTWENVRRGNSPIANNDRKTHCIRNHPFDDDNTRFYFRDGTIRRACKACALIVAANNRRKAKL